MNLTYQKRETVQRWSKEDALVSGHKISLERYQICFKSKTQLEARNTLKFIRAISAIRLFEGYWMKYEILVVVGQLKALWFINIKYWLTTWLLWLLITNLLMAYVNQKLNVVLKPDIWINSIAHYFLHSLICSNWYQERQYGIASMPEQVPTLIQSRRA
jgi:hypothetical protein